MLHSPVAPVRGLIVLIFDSLRADFQEICAEHGFALPGFDRLAQATLALPTVRCGSFPTVPMRTDFLTGELSFLDARWATPRLDQDTLTWAAGKIGFKSYLVTDNYMLFVPKLGGNITGHFADCRIIRGSGADPWAAVAERDRHFDQPERPARSKTFERQFVANLLRWRKAGGSPWHRLFHAASITLEEAIGSRFLLWVDCFSTHEPWIGEWDLGTLGPLEPIFPPYGRSDAVGAEGIAALKRRYAARIACVDRDLLPFVEHCEHAMASGDVALLILSDHGFLFGEFGLVGKPKTEPVLPPLADLVTWASPHFEDHTRSFLQPSDLHSSVLRLLGNGHTRPVIARLPGFQIVGRNSPEVKHLTVFTEESMIVLHADGTSTGPPAVACGVLNSSEPWELSAKKAVELSPEAARSLYRAVGNRPWSRNFGHALHAMGVTADA